jgi:hypothetical protein
MKPFAYDTNGYEGGRWEASIANGYRLRLSLFLFRVI